MASHNSAKIKIEDLEIIGYSVAGEETVIAMPQLGVCFDIGKVRYINAAGLKTPPEVNKRRINKKEPPT